MDKQIELLPCPFCAGEAKHFQRGTYETIYHGVTCHKNDGCVAQLTTAMFASPKQAAQAWNTRTTPTPPAGQVEAVALAIHNVKRSFGEAGEISLSEFKSMQNKASCNGVGNQYSQAMSYAKAAIKASGAEQIAIIAGLLQNIIDDEFTEHLFEAKETAKAALSYIPPELRGK